MGRRGHVQIAEPQYGNNVITDWAQDDFASYLENHGIHISTGNDFGDTSCADHWDIAIPYREATKKRKGYTDYAKIRRLIADLKSHPDKVTGTDGDPHGEAAACVLEEGLEVAIRNKSDFIVIDWF
jgi:hypothetical protein